MKKKFLVLIAMKCFIIGSLCAQERVITGTVTSDYDGLPLPGVTVVVDGLSNVGTITDFDGNYSIRVPEGSNTLVFSFVGMESKSVVIGSSNVINVVLSLSSETLDEVVVTALGIKRDVKAIGYSTQSIQQNELSGLKEASVSNLLAGKIAGVQVSKSASGTGGSTNVIIRGNNSIGANNQPLYVVDGVPIINQSNSNPGAGLGGADLDYGDGIFDINPEDIETINVLKGPNASALYGSRGANGVILITTKSGSVKKGFSVEFSSKVAVDQISLLPRFQNKFASGYDDDAIANWGKQEADDGNSYYYPEWGNVDSWGGPLDGSISIIDVFHFDGEPDGIMPLVAQPASNVKDLFYQNGFSNINNIAISGQNEKSSVRFSLGNTLLNGVIPNHKVKKLNFTLRATSQITEKLSVDGRISYNRTEGSQRPITGYSDNNPVWNLAIMARFTPLDFIKEYYEKTKSFARFPGENYNPWYIVNELKNNDTRDRFIGYMSATFNFNDWLSLTAKTSMDTYTDVRKNTWPVGARGSDNSRGRIQQSIGQHIDVESNAILMAQKQVSNDFSLSGSLGGNYLTQRRETMSWDGRIFKFPEVYDITNTQDVRPNYSLWRKEIHSLFFTAEAAFRNYLFLTLTGRNDWSSSLGINNNSYFYPSLSTSFIFTDAWKLESDILSFGKLRASWAQVGNDAEPYLTMEGYSLSTITLNGQSLLWKSGTVPLHNLKNELTESWEVGADLRFFKGRVSLDFTYYNGSTSDQILRAQIPTASGYSNAVINAGEIQNKGVEAVLGLTPINIRNGFRWDVNFNFAANRSKVVSLAPGIDSYLLMQSGEINVIEARVGEAFGNIVGYKYKRAPDGQKIVNENGGYNREERQSILGNINPDWTGGLNNTFSYKGLSMNVLLDFVQGGQLTSLTRYYMTMKGTGAWTVEGRRPVATDANGNQMPYVGVLDGVVEIKDADGNVTGYEKNTKAVPGQTYWANRAWSRIGEEFVMDASYISLREVVLSYSFPKSIIGKTPFSALSLSVIGRNLMYIKEHMKGTGVSPESQPNTAMGAAGIEALALPPTRTYGLNVNITF